MFEELAHHLLDTVYNSNVEAIKCELKNRAIPGQYERAEIIKSVLIVAHLTRHLIDAHGSLAIALRIIFAQLSAVLVSPILLDKSQSMIELRIPDNNVEVQFLHLLFPDRSHCSVSFGFSTDFGSCLHLLLLGVTTEAVIQIYVSLVLDFSAPVLGE